MEKYTICCTSEQTKKAYELGAPIVILPNYAECNVFPFVRQPNDYDYPCVVPTAEQMIGFIEDATGLEINIIHGIDSSYDYFIYKGICEVCNHGRVFGSRTEATLAAIDAALEYLSKNKK